MAEIINNAFFDSAINRINAIGSCGDLQIAVPDIMGPINEQKQAVLDQIASLAPMLALLNPPTSPTAVVTWAQNFITQFLTPALKPSITYNLELALLIGKISELTDAISAAADRFPNCTVTIV